MKQSNIKKIFVSAVFMIGAITGCSEKKSVENPTYDAVNAPVKDLVKPAQAADNSIAYYSENLNTALAVWKDCQKKGPDGMTDAELENCSNAQSAWELQPRKARK